MAEQIPDKLDPKKIALGCKPVEGVENILECYPTYEIDGKKVPLTSDVPLLLERVEPGKWRIKAGGKDLTVEKLLALKEAVRKVELKI